MALEGRAGFVRSMHRPWESTGFFFSPRFGSITNEEMS